MLLHNATLCRYLRYWQHFDIVWLGYFKVCQVDVHCGTLPQVGMQLNGNMNIGNMIPGNRKNDRNVHYTRLRTFHFFPM